MASSKILKSQRSSKVSTRDTYISRKNGLEKISTNIRNNFGDDITNINTQIGYCINLTERGFKGISKVSSISEEMFQEKESTIYYDSNISKSMTDISSEVIRCQGEIDRLNGEITDLDEQIKTAEEEESKAFWAEFGVTIGMGE